MNQSSFLVPHVQDYLLWALRRAVLARVEDLQLLVRLDELRVCAQREEDDAARRHEVFDALDQLAARAKHAGLAHRAEDAPAGRHGASAALYQPAARPKPRPPAHRAHGAGGADDAPVAPAHD